ncbi:hypothetical protein F1188_20195 [Roseospira marina]|uniref:Uncharacterized protein n=1 Tax=Roseospira marina TaxID=140057 RepID=A0A5M6I5H1_9PROT|nr:hypothetical protein F1188_20195 [Roseospira marina]
MAENPVTVGRSALKVVGWDHEAYEAGARTYASVGRWLGQGFTPDEIVAVFRRRTDIATARNPIAYAAKLMADEVQAMRAQTEADTKPLARTWGGKTEDEWRTRIEIGARAGWSDCWGFPPDDAGTLCPAHLRPEWEAALARGQAA